MTAPPTAAEFLSSATAAAPPPGGNTPLALEIAADMRRVAIETAAAAPRSRQRHLGPSEIGVRCDRQVVGKLVGEPVTNHVADPWPSIVGTATHAWLAEAFARDNIRTGMLRWVPEQRVTPHPDHRGTADLYDALRRYLIDHKVIGPTTMAKVQGADGPPRKYEVQLLLYGRGYRLLGLPVDGVALVAWPRTKSTLNELYVWDHPYEPADDELLNEVFEQLDTRKRMAALVAAGHVGIDRIPTTPEQGECYFCPFFRPEAARDGGIGCAGHIKGEQAPAA